jgi:Fur family ferric uptake transcriptional regulator
MLQKARRILEKHGIRKTDFRILVLEQFLSKPEIAVSQKYIEQGLGAYDRITLYRTLKSFEKLGVIHKAVDGGAEVKYALCHEDCSAHQHSDDHAHFYCQKCGDTFCLDQFDMPKLELNNDYIVKEVQIALSGICMKCNVS